MKIEAATENIAPQVGGWIGEQTRQLIGEIPGVSLQFCARDESGTLLGGVTGAIHHGILHVHQLATSPHHRKRGIGALLMRALECEAFERGATCALVDTLEFEAPDFYQKQDYAVLGIVGDQIGRRKFFLLKPLNFP